jgi:hypothetical protein
MGKGCKRRPCLVNSNEFADNWERAFSKKKEKPVKKQKEKPNA